MSYHETIRNLLEKDIVGDGERVIAKIAGTEHDAAWDEVIDNLCLLARKKHEIEELQAITEAKRVLFWHAVKQLSEQAESADDRGLALGIRHDEDGNKVLVEFKPKERHEGLPAFLRKMMDGDGFSGFVLGGGDDDDE